jgi:Amiloride-sensitive sodium channel
MSRVSIYIEDSSYDQTERYAVFDSMDFLASCGGFSGLFMGFSILSFIEIFYYFILWIIILNRQKANEVEPIEVFLVSARSQYSSDRQSLSN